jgi:hypothetical protein
MVKLAGRVLSLPFLLPVRTGKLLGTAMIPAISSITSALPEPKQGDPRRQPAPPPPALADDETEVAGRERVPLSRPDRRGGPRTTEVPASLWRAAIESGPERPALSMIRRSRGSSRNSPHVLATTSQ